MQKIIVPASAAAAIFGFAGLSWGAALADYNFLSAQPPASNTGYSQGPTTLAPNVTSSAISGGVGAGGAGAGNGGGTNGNGLLVDFTSTTATTGYSGQILRAVTNNGTETNEQQAIANASYWNFVVTPTNGAALNYSDISITGARGGTTTPRGFYIESSIDNPSNTWGTKDIFGIGSEQSQRPNLTTYNVSNYTSYETGGANASSLGEGSLNLATNPAYQNVTSPVEFRVFVIGPAFGNSIDFADFSVNGSVPEPAPIGILAIGVMTSFARRRRAPLQS